MMQILHFAPSVANTDISVASGNVVCLFVSRKDEYSDVGFFLKDSVFCFGGLPAVTLFYIDGFMTFWQKVGQFTDVTFTLST